MYIPALRLLRLGWAGFRESFSTAVAISVTDENEWFSSGGETVIDACLTGLKVLTHIRLTSSSQASQSIHTTTCRIGLVIFREATSSVRRSSVGLHGNSPATSEQSLAQRAVGVDTVGTSCSVRGSASPNFTILNWAAAEWMRSGMTSRRHVQLWLKRP
jgi:hypothetical protein